MFGCLWPGSPEHLQVVILGRGCSLPCALHVHLIRCPNVHCSAITVDDKQKNPGSFRCPALRDRLCGLPARVLVADLSDIGGRRVFAPRWQASQRNCRRSAAGTPVLRARHTRPHTVQALRAARRSLHWHRHFCAALPGHELWLQPQRHLPFQLVGWLFFLLPAAGASPGAFSLQSSKDFPP